MNIFAAGCVLFRRLKNTVKIAVIKKKKTGHWSLPKGKLDQGETTKEAALRELTEETGLVGEIINRIGLVHYQYSEAGKKQRIKKHVVFYLASFKKGKMTPGLPEVDEVRWIGIDDALKLLDYELERQIVIQARGVLCAQTRD